MAFSDPQSVNPGSGATSLPRTGQGAASGSFKSNDGTLTMDVNHIYGKRIRRSASVALKKYASDPTISGNSVLVGATVRLTIDQPIQGFSVAELTTLVTGLITNLTASSNANVVKLLGGES
ncbi:TPA_asm: coat protein [ssRNA phage Gerhypos.1_34]|uniref:Coat protein n=2 Tax=Leviviricetes TaxID=2842243 RepID=A0A8S5L391_9VIRU|nr:coat protein [ssRNA phage Gerhypos.1_34]QDH90976.1 MAG: hypothetical protein H1Bulk30182_000002 [Leviviridae sp.]DAD52137.1 TPA_asm: coat protein [ssRNA phage Gerhypos.1_34]